VNATRTILVRRLLVVSLLLLLLLFAAMLLGISMGSSGNGINEVLQSLWGASQTDSMLDTIIWRIRLPRAILAAFVGATLSLGGLVFQALLRNPLAEPYILGISGGSAIGAIIGILMGLSRFPGVSLTAFAGSTASLLLILVMSSGQTILKKDSLLLSGVMVNAFCSAFIMFLISLTQDPAPQYHVLADGGPFHGRYRAGMDTRRHGFALFYPDFLVVQYHESAASGQGDGPDHGGQHKGRYGDPSGEHLVHGECHGQPMRSFRVCGAGHSASAAAASRPRPPGAGSVVYFWRRGLYGFL